MKGDGLRLLVTKPLELGVGVQDGEGVAEGVGEGVNEDPGMMGVDRVCSGAREETCCSVSGAVKESVGDDPPFCALLIRGR